MKKKKKTTAEKALTREELLEYKLHRATLAGIKEAVNRRAIQASLIQNQAETQLDRLQNERRSLQGDLTKVEGAQAEFHKVLGEKYNVDFGSKTSVVDEETGSLVSRGATTNNGDMKKKED